MPGACASRPESQPAKNKRVESKSKKRLGGLAAYRCPEVQERFDPGLRRWVVQKPQKDAMCWCGKPMSKHAYGREGLLIHNGPKSKSRKAPIAKKKRASGTSTQSASQDAWATLATEHLKHDEKILRKADALDRKRSLDASRVGDGPTFKEVDGRWLRVEGFSEELAAHSPWVVHPPSGSGKAKGAKAAALSRNFSVTRVAKDGTGSVWVQGDIVPSMKKDELVGGAISVDNVDNMAVCQPVRPMAMGVKPAK